MAAKRGWADRGLEALARFGFLARGVVYLVVGGVAARAAFLQRGRATGPVGALRAILQGWNGRVALAVVAAGLLSLIFFRLAQAARAKDRFARVAALASAIGLLALAVSAAGLLFGVRGALEDEPLRAWGSRLLAHGWGRGGAMLVGAVTAVAGAVEGGRALLGKLPSDFSAALIARQNRGWAYRLARAGVLAHGVVLVAVGLSILRAGLDANPRELVGTGGALRTIRRLHAPELFLVVSAGLLSYGTSLMVLAAHQRRSPSTRTAGGRR